MIKYTTPALALLLTSLQAQAIPWKDLWLTPDQQAQRLMQQGNYTQAKDQFANPHWAAAAAYKAGEYEQAGRLFKMLDTQQGYYNQGNALAHQGQYEEAIKAYDKALDLNPKDQDAIDNRELLKQLLKKDKEKQQNKDQDKNKDKKDKDEQNKDEQNKDEQNKDQQNKDQQNKDQQNKDQQNKDQQNKDQQNKDKQNKDKQNKTKPNQTSHEKPKDAKQMAADKEKQQAKEQWLQLIPDDPGGLLREKFLRDHLRRERGWYQ